MSRIVLHLPIYTFHIDSGQHVSNIVYVQWMEIGRNKLLEEVGLPVHEIAKDRGIAPVLVSTEITYKKQLFLGDKVRMELWLSELGNASAVMEFLFLNDSGTEVAAGRQKGIFFNTATKRPHRLSEAERKLFTTYLEIRPDPAYDTLRRNPLPVEGQKR